ncbi:MAG: neutral zinc metallopeptidase [Deltaproteobacteria bacterium]|nr:neutral zinc metallopeptidase [Deltaproteobacteria bacterium]
MFWDKNHRSSNVDDRRAAGPARGMGGGGLPLGSILAIASRFGWKGILIAVVVIGALMFGGGGLSMCSGGGAPSQQATPEQQTKAPAEQDELASFIGFVLDDVQKTFGEQLTNYELTRLTLFRESVNSACGTASAAVGPFYCPLDKRVFIDLTFYDELRRRFGAPGDFAQAYVIAHEVGHHVQNIRGKLGKGEVNQIETELQADCLAGAWAKSAQERGLLEVGDVDEALTAAAAIGDDTIQRKTTGRVQPETWTHGSAAQRSAAFKKGLQGGISACGMR